MTHDYVQTEKFLKEHGISYSELTPNPSDPPDFILRTENKIIAIEHTLLTNKREKAIVSIYKTYDEIISLAQKKYSNTNLPIITTTIQFSSKLDTTKGKAPKLVEELFNIVSNNIPELGNNIYVEYEVPQSELPPYTSSILISRNIKSEHSVWQRTRIVWSGPLQNIVLEENISRKNNRLLETKYSLSYDEAWLLLIVEGTEWSEFSN